MRVVPLLLMYTLHYSSAVNAWQVEMNIASILDRGGWWWCVVWKSHWGVSTVKCGIYLVEQKKNRKQAKNNTRFELECVCYLKLVFLRSWKSVPMIKRRQEVDVTVTRSEYESDSPEHCLQPNLRGLFHVKEHSTPRLDLQKPRRDLHLVTHLCVYI